MAKRNKLLDDYLSHGRQFRLLGMQALEQRWYIAIRDGQQASVVGGQQLFDALKEINHIEAEFLLREVVPPRRRPS